MTYGYETYPEIRIEEVFQKLFAEKGVSADEALVLHAGQFFRVLATEYIRLYKGVILMLGRLWMQGKKIYLLSNAQRIFTEYEMRMLDVARYFDGIMISSDYGVKKPDRIFYELLLEKYHLAPEDSIMIGNDAKTDIAGAAGVGMDTCYIHSNLSPEHDLPVKATYVLDEMNIDRLCRMLEIL
ncbi:MAG: HAD family hydrolase [Lachnospiraceae bacterium]|nr:HAD family hydrolase [Lachnospiraceae bacterium]